MKKIIIISLFLLVLVLPSVVAADFNDCVNSAGTRTSLCNPLLPGAALLLAAIAFAIVDQARRLPDDRRLNRRVEA